MKTDLSIYSTKGIDTIGRNVVRATRQNKQEEAKTNVLFVETEKELNVYSPLVLKATTTGMSKDENDALDQVIKNYKRMRKLVDASALFPDTEKGRAALPLQEVFKRAGKLYEEKKGEVAASVENLLQEFAKPEMTAHIVTLGIGSEAQDLRAAKTAFDTVAGQRLDARSELRQTDSASIGRKKFEQALRNYLRFVTAMRNVPGWEDLYSDLNEVMKAARLSVRQGKEPEIITDVQPEV